MPTRTLIEAGIVSRIAAGLRYALTGSAPNEWFGPAAPIAPATEGEQAQSTGVAGRQLDYRTGFNVDLRPRAGEAIGYPQMRALADACDVLRLVIETRKDQVCSLGWEIMPKDAKKKADDRCKAVSDFFLSPDKEHSWDEWLRMLLEDLYVIDAPSLYVRKTLGGGLFSLDPVDGATIKRVIDATGRTPADGPAYQQILKGVPAVDYAREELIYKPRNIRTCKVYGYSPVEQIINTVSIALRRSQFTLDYFTGGTVPDALAGVPESWTTDQIAEFQRYWDLLLSSEDGGMTERRKLKFVPGEISRNFKETKQPPLKDLFDEWLARVICYSFSVEPTPFVSQVNRATAETTREQSLAEGLAPTKQWVKSLVDRIIRQCFGFTDIEFRWSAGKIIDPAAMQTIMSGYVAAKIMHPDEARAELGLDPLTPEQKEDMTPAPPPMLASAIAGPVGKPPAKKPEQKPIPEEEGEQSESAKEALFKAKKSIRRIDRNRSAVTDAIAAITEAIATFLNDKKASIIDQIIEAAGLEKSAQSGTPGARARHIVDSLDVSDWDELVGVVQPMLAGLVVDGGTESLKLLNMDSEEVLKAVSEDATAWASDRAAELVGMRWEDGELIPNPDAQWQITEGTREFLRADVETAMTEGWSNQELSAALSDNYAFSDTRADMIARTETARADIEGSRIGWRASGVVSGREWDAAPECCDECQGMNGQTAELDGQYKGGLDVPLHPNCRCDELPILSDNAPPTDD